MAKVVILGFCIILIITVVMYKLKKKSKNQSRAGSCCPNNVDLELLVHQPTNINFFKYISGTIRNNTNRSFSNVEVKIDIFANNTEFMGSTVVNTINLGPRECWDFQAPVLEQGEFSYRFVSITGS